jgi:hypothetical protein
MTDTRPYFDFDFHVSYAYVFAQFVVARPPLNSVTVSVPATLSLLSAATRSPGETL